MNTPGVYFKQGKLRIFTEDEAMTVEAWPSLKAVQKVGIAPWEEYEPGFRILIPPETLAGSEAEETLPNDETFSRQRQKAFAAFRARIPVPVAVLVEKYQSRQLKLLRLLLAREFHPKFRVGLGHPAHFAGNLRKFVTG